MAKAIEQVYDQLTQVFGGTNPDQFFTLLMPGTLLNQSDFRYDTTRVKPGRVERVESRLVDEMFDIAKVTASSNGQHVSSQYLQALSTLVPTFDPMLPEVKNLLRDFINSPAAPGAMVNGKPFSGTLAEHYFALYQRWLDSKTAWQVLNLANRDKLSADDYLEWYEEHAEGALAAIDAAFGELLAVTAPADMEAILGALGAGPGGEIDEATRLVQDIRLPTPDGGYVYPVDLTPSDWFVDLASDIDPGNLLKDPEFIGATLAARRQAVQASIGQVRAVLERMPSTGDIKKAADNFLQAQADFAGAQRALLDVYTANTVTAVEIYLKAHGKGVLDAASPKHLAELDQHAKAVSTAGGAAPPGTGCEAQGRAFGIEDVKKIAQGQDQLNKAQSDLLQKSQALASAGIEAAATKAAGYAELPSLLGRLQSQLQEIDTLQTQLGQSIEAAARRVVQEPPPARTKEFESEVGTLAESLHGLAIKKETTPQQIVDAIKKQADSPLKPEDWEPIRSAFTQATNAVILDGMQKKLRAVADGGSTPPRLQTIVDAAYKAPDPAALLAALSATITEDAVDGDALKTLLATAQLAAKKDAVAIAAKAADARKDFATTDGPDFDTACERAQAATTADALATALAATGRPESLDAALKKLRDAANAVSATTPPPKLETVKEAVAAAAKQPPVKTWADDAAHSATANGVLTAVAQASSYAALLDILAESTASTTALTTLKNTIGTIQTSADPALLARIDLANQAVAQRLTNAPTASKSGTSERFMTLQMSFNSEEMDSSQSDTASFSQTSWHTNFFFGSASGQSSTGSALNTKNAFDASTEIQIAFKAAKVDVTRPWLNPGLFKLTRGMNCLTGKRATLSPSFPRTTTGEIDWSKATTLQSENSNLLPCIPVAFVIAKDISIRFKASESSLSAIHSVLDNKAASGGGLFCFSVASSSQSHSDTSSLHTHTQGNVITITMPAPQILGWFLQLMPADESQPLTLGLQSLGQDLSIVNFVKRLRRFDSSSTKPAATAAT